MAAGAWRWPLTPFWCHGHERIELYLYSPNGPYSLYRVSVRVQGCTLPFFHAPVQTGPRAHPASCTMDTGSFPGVKSGRGMTLTPHPLLVPWSWESRAIPLLPLWAVWPVQSLCACARVHFHKPLKWVSSPPPIIFWLKFYVPLVCPPYFPICIFLSNFWMWHIDL